MRITSSLLVLLISAPGCAGGRGPVRRFEHGPGWARSAAFSRDGKYLAATSEDGRVRVWDVATGRELASAASPAPVPRRDYTLDGAAFSPDGESVAFAAQGGRAFAWRWRDDVPPRNVATLDVPVRQLAFSPDGGTLTAVGGGMELSPNPRPGENFTVHPFHARRVELASGRVVDELRDSHCGAMSVAVAPTGTRIAVVCLTQADGQPVRTMSLDEMRGARTRLSVRVVATGDEVISIDHVRHMLQAVSPDGEAVIAGTNVWDVQTGHFIRKIEFSAPTFTPDGVGVIALEQFFMPTHFLSKPTALGVRPARIDLCSGRRAFGKRLLFRTPARSIEPPVRAAFSPDGRYFVDHDLNLWRVTW